MNGLRCWEKNGRQRLKKTVLARGKGYADYRAGERRATGKSLISSLISDCAGIPRCTLLPSLFHNIELRSTGIYFPRCGTGTIQDFGYILMLQYF